MLPKDIDKKMKASGLKKLRFYCQVCEKQCGNDVGFRRHCESESHLRKMMVFRDNSMELMEEYSRTMEKEYIALLRRYGTKQVDANVVYQEYIAHREHVHMNATKWDTLTTFVKYLGKSGKCAIEFRDDKWWVSYIDNDPNRLERDRKAAQIKAQIRDVDTLSELQIQEQLERARAAEEAVRARAGEAAVSMPVGTVRDKDRGSMRVDLSKASSSTAAQKSAFDFLAADQDDDSETDGVPGARGEEDEVNRSQKPRVSAEGSKRRSRFESEAVTLARAQGQEASANTAEVESARTERPWVREGLVVRVLDAQLEGGKYYRAKGEVRKLFVFCGGTLVPVVDEEEVRECEREERDRERQSDRERHRDRDRHSHSPPHSSRRRDADGFVLLRGERACTDYPRAGVAEVRLPGVGGGNGRHGEGHVDVRLPLSDLETVIPGLGREVAVVQGRYSDPSSGHLRRATLVEADLEAGWAKVRLESRVYGSKRGEVVKVGFDDICKTIYS